MSRLGCPLFEASSRGGTVFCLVPHYWEIIRSINSTGKHRQPLKRVLLNYHFDITGHRPSTTYEISQVGWRSGAPSTLLLAPSINLLCPPRGSILKSSCRFILSSLAVDSLARTSQDGDLPTLLQFLSSLQGNLLKLARPQATSAYSMICGCADWMTRLEVSWWSPAWLQPMSDTKAPAQAIAAGALVMNCHHVQLPLACLLLNSLYHLLVTQFQLKWYYGQHPPGRHALNNQINANPRRARCQDPYDLNHPRLH